MLRWTSKSIMVSVITDSVLSAVSLGLAIGVTVAWHRGYAVLPPCVCPSCAKSRPEVELGRLRQMIELPSDFNAGEIAQALQSSLASLYLRVDSVSSDYSNQAWPDSSYLGGALVLTTDGWLIAHRVVIGDVTRERIVVVAADGIRYPVQERVDDAAIDLVYLRVSAANLTPAPFTVASGLASGQTVVGLSSRGDVAANQISNVRYFRRRDGSSLLDSSERLLPRVALSQNVGRGFAGGVVTDLEGGLVGFFLAADSPEEPALVLPLAILRPSVDRFLQTQRVVHPYLGVEYLDVAHVVGLSASLTAGNQRGALIAKQPQPGSPAAFANLMPGDIIMKVDGNPVDASASLAERIFNLTPSDRITLEVSRQGKTILI